MEFVMKKIREAEDLADVIELMQNLNIPTKGCKTVNQMKERIYEHLLTRRDNQLSSNEAFRVISDARSMDRAKSLDLLTFYSKVEREISELDDSFLDLLKTSEGDVLLNMKTRMERMESRDYVVLVAGETSAGKSSMLNLILGEELLPFSVLSTTSTICELKYGKKKRIKIHYKEAGKEPRIKDLDESSPYVDQISEFVHVKSPTLREKASDYSKVELFWPQKLLQDRIVIVDSPGVGESEIMDDIVVNYLPNAFAFIYVINSSNAGGVQKDRLVRLLHKTRQLTTEQLMEFSPDCTLFVCNKWDIISPDEASDVSEHIKNVLRQCLQDIDTDTQVIRLSTTKALRAQKFGIMNAEFASLTESIGCLVAKSIETRLARNWSWLDQLLSRIVWMMTFSIDNVNSDHEAATERLTHVIERLGKLQAEQESSKEELRTHLRQETSRAVKVLIDYLKSPEVIKSFCRWNSDELPDAEGSWGFTESAIMKLIKNRLQTLIEEWEAEHQHFAKARKSVVTFFLSKYNYLENELRCVEVDAPKITATPQTTRRNNSLEEKLLSNVSSLDSRTFAEITMPFLSPGTLALVKRLVLSVGLLVLPVVGVMAIAEHVHDKRKIRIYKEDRSGFVTEISQNYLEAVATHESLRPLVEDQLMQCVSCLKELQAKIPMLIEADTKLCRQLIDESRSKKDTEAEYRPRKDKCDWLRGELALYGSLEIRGMAIAWDSLEWKDSEKVNLNHSLPPGIYQGRISKGRYASSRQVTLKVYKELLTNSNAIKCLENEATMSRLRHPHIVAFYGAACRKVPRGLEVTFVMECSGETLKKYLIDQPENCPSLNPLSTQGVIQWTEQIVDALMVIHSASKECVHGDLRLENVLLDSSDNRNVKLSNICLTRELTIEPGSKSDEFLRLPPEAVRNKAYYASSEIYSFGIMLWEMWYGQEAFLEMKDQDLEVFLVSVEEGRRPELTGLTTEASMWWSELLSGCWERNAAERNTLADCKSAITAMLDNYK